MLKSSEFLKTDDLSVFLMIETFFFKRYGNENKLLTVRSEPEAVAVVTTNVYTRTSFFLRRRFGELTSGMFFFNLPFLPADRL